MRSSNQRQKQPMPMHMDDPDLVQSNIQLPPEPRQSFTNPLCYASTMHPVQESLYSQHYSDSTFLPPASGSDTLDNFGGGSPSFGSVGAFQQLQRDGASFTIASMRSPREAPRGVFGNGLASEERSKFPSASRDAYNGAISTAPVHHPVGLPAFSAPVLPPPPTTAAGSAFLPTFDGQNMVRHLPLPSGITSPGSVYAANAAFPPATSFITTNHPFEYSPRQSYPINTYERPMAPTRPSTGGRANSPADETLFPYATYEELNSLTSETGQEVRRDVFVQQIKGPHTSAEEPSWFCYRRNYFEVICTATLDHIVPGGQYYFQQGREPKRMVKAFAVKMEAAIDSTAGSRVEIYKFTAKRDKEKKIPYLPVRIMPVPSATFSPVQLRNSAGAINNPATYYGSTPQAVMPFLPLQHLNEPDPVPQGGSGGRQAVASPAGRQEPAGPSQSAPSGTATQHHFQRLQFCKATANNGKRRASQQFFVVWGELMVDVRPDGANEPVWKPICRKVSQKTIVRGRSPSHYAPGGGPERPFSTPRALRDGTVLGPPRHMNANPRRRQGGPNRGPAGPSGAGAYTGAGAHMPNLHPQYASEIPYRQQHTYSLPEDSGGSEGSPESLHDEIDDSGLPSATYAAGYDRAHLPSAEGYSYHPTSIYDQPDPLRQFDPLRLPPLGLEAALRDPMGQQFPSYRADLPQATAGAQWHADGSRARLYTYSSSRNLYPHVPPSEGSYS